MLELKKAESEDALHAFCECSNQMYDEKFEAYEALDGDEIVGYCLFLGGGETLLLADAQVKDEYGPALADGLVRAVFNYGLSLGLHRAFFAAEFNEKTWESLASFGHGDKCVKDIDNFLSNQKNCGS